MAREKMLPLKAMLAPFLASGARSATVNRCLTVRQIPITVPQLVIVLHIICHPHTSSLPATKPRIARAQLGPSSIYVSPTRYQWQIHCPAAPMWRAAG